MKNRMDEDGTCSSHVKEATGTDQCTGYCEVRNYYSYGREIRFDEFGTCRAHQECSFTSTNSLTVTQTFEVNTGVKFGKRDSEGALIKRGSEAEALKIGFDLVISSSLLLSVVLCEAGIDNCCQGASYSFSVAKQTSSGIRLDRPEGTQNNCGYWTL